MCVCVCVCLSLCMSSALLLTSNICVYFWCTRQASREALWQLAWAAVRVCVCFESPGLELPTHLCRQLRELYSGGSEAEFRYSHNIQSTYTYT